MTIFKIPRTFTLKANSVRATKQFISRFSFSQNKGSFNLHWTAYIESSIFSKS